MDAGQTDDACPHEAVVVGPPGNLWPDGMYSASAYESIIYVIGKTKDLGFNMIREYVKVRPAFWYTF